VALNGGKHYLARQIVGLMPRHLHYVEPFAGGLAVLLAKTPQGISEVVNDLHGPLINFWAVLRTPGWFLDFQRRVETTPFSEAVWEECADFCAAFPLPVPGSNRDDVLDTFDRETRVTYAWAFFVCCRMSLAGRMNAFTGVTKTRTRRGMNNEVSAWLRAVEGLPLVHERLKRVLVLHRPALEVIESHAGPQTLQYLDPPYLPETRAVPKVYNHEMTVADHEALLALLCRLGRDPGYGKFILSGYANPLYDEALSATQDAGGRPWRRVVFDLPNHAAAKPVPGKTKRRMEEVLWMNY
jgi:DNA adenine methylase